MLEYLLNESFLIGFNFTLVSLVVKSLYKKSVDSFYFLDKHNKNYY
jgi:hypothetical protein